MTRKLPPLLRIVRTAVGRWCKMLGKISVKKMQASVAVLKTKQCLTGSQCNFLSTGVTLVYLLVFDIILAAPLWVHCNLCRLDLERLLKKSELQ